MSNLYKNIKAALGGYWTDFSLFIGAVAVFRVSKHVIRLHTSHVVGSLGDVYRTIFHAPIDETGEFLRFSLADVQKDLIVLWVALSFAVMRTGGLIGSQLQIIVDDSVGAGYSPNGDPRKFFLDFNSNGALNWYVSAYYYILSRGKFVRRLFLLTFLFIWPLSLLAMFIRPLCCGFRTTLTKRSQVGQIELAQNLGEQPFGLAMVTRKDLSQMLGYAIKEISFSLQNRTINIPKNLLIIGTTLSWFVGIIHFNNDLAFTATNVIAHGIPYIALIWIYGRNRGSSAPKLSLFSGFSFKQLFSLPMLPVYIGVLVLLGYVEEGLWDGFIWTEHKGFFRLFQPLPAINDKALASWVIPLLALPQMTHYALDAFIWRLNEPNTEWKRVLFYKVRPT